MSTARITFDSLDRWFAKLVEHINATYVSSPETPENMEAYKDIMFELGRLILSTDHDGAAPIHRGHIRAPFDIYFKHVRNLRGILETSGVWLTVIQKEILLSYIDQMLDPVMFYNIAKEKRVGFMGNIPKSRRRKNTSKRETTRRPRTNRNTAAAEYVSDDDEFRKEVMRKSQATRKTRTNRNTTAAEYVSDDDEFRKEVMLKASRK